MSLFIESLKCLDGKPMNAGFHNDRMNEVRKRRFGRTDLLDLEKIIVVPENIKSAIVKSRVIYSEGIVSVSSSLYLVRRPRTLKIVRNDEIDYADKYEDRSGLERLLRMRDSCDDIMIIKAGMVTDSSAANIVFFDGKDYFTPSTPLLKGTKRRKFIEQGIIKEAEIREQDIFQFKEISLINAMLEFGETRIPVDSQSVRK